tara:strand:+ start:115 stop:1206 length:1092 start_codon:yes stop_codon:yes gene_type:complete
MDNLQLLSNIVIIIFLSILIILFIKNKWQKNSSKNLEEIKTKEDINELKEKIDNQITTMSTSFNILSKDVTRDMTNALTKVDEKVGVFNKQVEDLNKSQESFSKILAGVKKYGTLAEFSLASILKDLLPASQYISNVKMKEDTGENVEFAVRLQDGVLVPIDSHFPVEKFSAISDAYQAKDKKAIADARDKLASAFKNKAKKVNEKYIVPPKTTDFAIIYAPTESLFSELTSYQDPNTKELLTRDLMQKYKIIILGPNTLSAYLQSLHMGFQTLKVQKNATKIYNDLRSISSRFNKHFDGVLSLRKTLEEALNHTDDFGRDARSIMRTLENIKNPDTVEKINKKSAVELKDKDEVDKIKSLNK